MNPFEKEYNLKQRFPTFKMNEKEKAKILDEILHAADGKRPQWSISLKGRGLLTLAATFLLLVGAMLTFMFYQHSMASLYQEEKIITDMNIAMEKARTVLIPSLNEQAGIQSSLEANELLSGYYEGQALIEIMSVWEQIQQEQDEALLYGTIAEIALSSLHNGENITITEIDNQSRIVQYFDVNLNKEVEIICILKNKQWVINEVNRL